MNTHVTHYVGTAHYPSTGSTHEGTYPFLEEHAQEAGIEFTDRGIPVEDAKKLIARWNARQSADAAVRYRYSLPYLSRLLE